MSYTDSISKTMKHIFKQFNTSSTYIKIIFGMFLLYIVYKLHYFIFTSYYQYAKKEIETFTGSTLTKVLDLSHQKEKAITLKDGDIYDEFYSIVYDEVMNDPNLTHFQYEMIEKSTNIKPISSNNPSVICDIGSGNGHLVQLFNENNYNCYGLDKSKAMIQYAKQNYPNIKNKFIEGNALYSQQYIPEKYDVITVLYFTIYEIQDKKGFLQNCYTWLKPSGYLVLHLVNRNKFPAIVNASDILNMVSPQKYSKEQLNTSVVSFKDFDYESYFTLDTTNNYALFKEKMIDDKNNKLRIHENTLYMPTQKEILNIAKQIGFIMQSKIEMIHAQYEYQYLYVLQKPN